MKNKPAKKMSMQDRAKQFASFQALGSLEEQFRKIEERFEDPKKNGYNEDEKIPLPENYQ